MDDDPTPSAVEGDTTQRVVRRRGQAGDGDRPRRGRPPGSRNKRTAGPTDASGLTRRIQALVRQNEELRAKVRDLESSFRKIEKALAGPVARTRTTSPPSGRRRGRPPKPRDAGTTE